MEEREIASQDEMQALTALYELAWKDGIAIWENYGMAAAMSKTLWLKLHEKGVEQITDLLLGDMVMGLNTVPGSGATRVKRVTNAIAAYKRVRSERPDLDWDGNELEFALAPDRV